VINKDIQLYHKTTCVLNESFHLPSSLIRDDKENVLAVNTGVLNLNISRDELFILPKTLSLCSHYI